MKSLFNFGDALFIVEAGREDAANSLIKKLCGNPLKPGAIIRITKEEETVLRGDIIGAILPKKKAHTPACCDTCPYHAKVKKEEGEGL